MIEHHLYDSIILIIMSGELTLNETEELTDLISTLDQKNEDIFMISIPINMTAHPTKLAEMMKASDALQKAQRNVKRLYGIKYNALFSFLSLVAVQLLRLKSNTVEAANLEDLYQIIERETQMFPALKRSWEKYGDTIKAKLNHYEAQKLV